jgi:hypothetical protein
LHVSVHQTRYSLFPLFLHHPQGTYQCLNPDLSLAGSGSVSIDVAAYNPSYLPEAGT